MLPNPDRLVGIAALAMSLSPAVGLLAVQSPWAAENKYAVAVIIGNRDYAGPVPDVEFAHNDAQAMRRYVIDVLGYRDGNIIDLRDATKARIEAVFGTRESHRGKLFNWVRPGKSDVVVFYSGHGVPGQKGVGAYLLPVDGDPNLAELTGYPIDLLYDNLSKIEARSITVFLDACFTGDSAGGLLLRAASGLSVAAKLPLAPAALTVLTAAQGDQVASWDETARHGLFTEHLLTALYGAADKDGYGNGDGRVSVAEVRHYLDEEMTYQARRQFGRDQRVSVLGDHARTLATLAPGLVRPRIEELADIGGDAGSDASRPSATVANIESSDAVARSGGQRFDGVWSGLAHKNSSGTVSCPSTIRIRLVVSAGEVSGGAISQGHGSVVTGRVDARGVLKARATSWAGMWGVQGAYARGTISGEVTHPSDCNYPFTLTRTTE